MCRDTRGALAAAVVVASLAVTARAQEVCDAYAAPPGASRGGGAVSGVPTFSASAAKGALRPRSVALGPLDRARLRLDEAHRNREAPDGTVRFGVRRAVPSLAAPRRLVPGARGVHAAPDGGLVWVGEVSAPGAAALRLRFSRFDLPDGASVTLHDADEPAESYGPFVSRGPGPDGAWDAPTVYGARVRVELLVPPGAANSPVALAVRSLLDVHTADAGALRPRAATCPQMDVACDTYAFTWAARAVTLLRPAHGTGLSGALLNDLDTTTTYPWVLTAAHGVSTQFTATSLEFYFDDFAPVCSGAAPALQDLPRARGASLSATAFTSDATLLRIEGAMPSGRTYLGWRSDAVTSGDVVTVHHPALEPMKVAHGTLLQGNGAFHFVRWTANGFAEPGSSGSPLLEAEGRVIGTCSGGDGTLNFCSPDNPTRYGRLDAVWPVFGPLLARTPPGGGGSGGGGGGGVQPPPPPTGPPLDFYWGLWNRASLGAGASQAFTAYLFPPPWGTKGTRLDVRVRGPRGTWVRLVAPDGAVHDVVGRGRIPDPPGGEWIVELHAAESARKRPIAVRVRKNF